MTDDQVTMRRSIARELFMREMQIIADCGPGLHYYKEKTLREKTDRAAQHARIAADAFIEEVMTFRRTA